MSWMNSGGHLLSESKVSHLVKDVILADDFDREHLQNFSVRRSLRELDKDDKGRRVTFPDDWIETSVTIDIPTKSKEGNPQPYTIDGFHYRPFVEVIRAAFADVQARAFHLLPFQRLWKDPLDGHQERIFDELYTSDAWLEAQDKLPKEPGCSLERVIVGLMPFSDATHLANFGTAKAWPLYMYFGNLTKYARSSPRSGACHLVGFLPSVRLLEYSVLSSVVDNISFRTVSRILSVPSPEYRKPAWRPFMRTAAGSCFTPAGASCWTKILFPHIAMVSC